MICTGEELNIVMKFLKKSFTLLKCAIVSVREYNIFLNLNIIFFII